MNTAVINIKTDPKIKAKAQGVASELGLSLSAIINGYLNNLVRTKTVYFSVEEPSEWMIKRMRESEADRKAGRVVSFENPEKALQYLDKLIDDRSKNKKSRVLTKVSKTTQKSSFAYSG